MTRSATIPINLAACGGTSATSYAKLIVQSGSGGASAVEAVADRCRRMFESEREWGEDVDAAIAEAVEAEAEKFRSSLRDWQD